MLPLPPGQPLAIRFGAYLRAHDPAAPNDFACFGGHRRHYSGSEALEKSTTPSYA
jgi:hypothetical protein